MERELLIIGGGPGGYVAAIRGAQLGAKVTIVEEDKLGGTCLNRGCIPTKALYKNAEVINTLKHIDDFGVSISDFKIDMNKVQSRKNSIVDKLVSGIDQLLKSYGIEVLKGTGVLKGNKTVEIKCSDTVIETTAKNIILATGSSCANIPVPGTDLEGVITSDEALNLDYIPKNITILGGGVVGVEFAGIFAALGSEVTIVEFLPRLIYKLDEELSKRLTMYLKKQKIQIITATEIKEVQQYGDKLKIIASNEKGTKEIITENLLMAAGRIPNLNKLNLDAENITYDKKGIKVDENYETSSKGIYAIGDVIGGQMLAHVASEEGRICVENMLGFNTHVNYNAVPSCIFSFPEVSSAGMTEAEAKEKGINYIVGKSMFASNGKALTIGEVDGFIKIIAHNENHKILGVHIIGPHASDLIHEGVVSIQNNLTIEDVKEAMHAHPTLSEVFYEAVCGCIGEATHSLPSRK